MKVVVVYFELYIEGEGDGFGWFSKVMIVLVMVKGDVYDIGKNFVDIIFFNNGYEVVNIGIK